jgi:hypothetical protein
MVGWFAARRPSATPARKRILGSRRHACQVHSTIWSAAADRIKGVRKFTQRQLHAPYSSNLTAIGYRHFDHDPAGGKNVPKFLATTGAALRGAKKLPSPRGIAARSEA